MSCDVFAVHMYGVDVYDLKLRPEIIKKIEEVDEDAECATMDELFDLFRDGEEGVIPKELDKKLSDYEDNFHYGPGATLYFGFDAIMPYEKTRSKEDLDKEAFDFLAYFCGEEAAKGNPLDEIYEVWIE